MLALLFSFCLPEFARAAVSLNAEEQKLAQLLTGASGQRRDRSKMFADERLCQVARARAMDMARRKYFDHVNPDGYGPNYLVRQTGYVLPSHYSTAKSGNNIESIGCGYANASAAWTGWMGSSGHKTHLLATQSFYTDQTAYGVGYHYDPSSPYGRYYVVLTAPPASAPVTLTITSPLSGSRVETNAVTVTGQVSGADTVGQMHYRLENAAGTSPWQSLPVPSGSSVSNWSANVNGLALGTNTVRVRTLSANGSVLKEATRSVRRAVLRPLTVEVNGDGSVGGFAGTTQRELGMVYTIRALRRPSTIFSHWEGFPDAAERDLTKAAQTFAMTEGLVLRANFIPNPFFSRNGVYEGLVLGGSLEHGANGFLRLNVARNGGFSGQLILGAARLPVRGTLNSAGSATVSVPRPGLPNLTLSVQLDLAGSTSALTANLSDGTATWSVQANRRALPQIASAAPARRYTFRIDPDLSAPELPRGFGFGKVVINAGNMAVVNGRLGDGRPLAATASMAEDGSLAIFAPQFGRAGAFYAALQITSGDLLDGTARWIKPERLQDLRHPAAFASTHTVVGGRYLPPAAGAPALDWGIGATGVVTLSGGNLEAALAQSVTLGVAPVFSWASAVIPGFRVSANPVTGNVGGTFLHPNGTLRAFRGVIIQHLGGAWGQFNGPSESGAMTLLSGAE